MTDITVRVIDCHVFLRQGNTPRYLLLKRSPDRIYPGIWQCVTGKIDPPEKPWETALREVKEETGSKVAHLWTVELVNHYYEAECDRMNLIPVFAAEVISSEITLSAEHSEFKWCTYEEATSRLLWAQQKDGLARFQDMLNGDPLRLKLNRITL